MLILQAICIFLLLCYAVLMLLYRAGWQMQETFVLPAGYKPSTHISIIIPARNEEKNIKACIDSILKQDYPKALLEVIVVDDHSDDDTAGIVNSYGLPGVRCISLAAYMGAEAVNAFKKKALSAGISVSKGELIITTDADCTMPATWLSCIAAKYEQDKPAMIVAPVDYTCDGSHVQVFQSLDFMSMQGITAASHRLRLGNMSNGANLAFTRAAFNTVNGYTGTEHLASGDDYLLMMKIQAAFPKQVAYLKAKKAIVHTAPQPSWNSFLQQRIRWASKSGKYDDKRMTAILMLVYLFNLSFIVVTIALTWFPALLGLLIVMLVTKTTVELIYLFPVAQFFNKTKQLAVFPFLQPAHIIYIVLAGLLGFAGVYTWKGRRVR